MVVAPEQVLPLVKVIPSLDRIGHLDSSLVTPITTTHLAMDVMMEEEYIAPTNPVLPEAQDEEHMYEDYPKVRDEAERSPTPPPPSRARAQTASLPQDTPEVKDPLLEVTMIGPPDMKVLDVEVAPKERVLHRLVRYQDAEEYLE